MEPNWRSKVARAREHLESLIEEVRIFMAAEPYRVESSREGNDVVVRVRDLAPIPPKLSLIVGDAVHNARSALDHLVMDLAERGHGTLGGRPATEAEERRLFFPVSSDRAGFRKWAGTVKPYLSTSAIACIEACQTHTLLEQIESDMEGLLVKWAGGGSSIRSSRKGWFGDAWGQPMVVRSACLFDAWSRLICAGWLPQDRVFGGSFAAF